MTLVRRQCLSPGALAVAAALALILGASIVRLSVVVALAAPVILGVLVLPVLVSGIIRWPDEAACRRVLVWTMASFAAHLVFGLMATYLSRQVRFYLGPDSFNYDLVASQLSDHWRYGMHMPAITHGKEGFYYLLAALYWVFGSHAAAGLAVNAIFGAALVPIVSDTTHRLFGPAAARYAGPLVVVLPGLFLWTSLLMKEPTMLLLLAIAANCAVRLVDRMSLASLSLLTMSLLLAFTVRAWVGLAVAAGFVAAIAISSRHLIRGVGNGLSAVVIVAAMMVGSGVGYSGYQTAINADLATANDVRTDLSTSAATGYDTTADISSAGAALSYLPRGMVNFVFGPMPWQIQGARQLPFVPDLLVWWALLPSLWLGLRSSRRLVGKRTLLVILPALTAVVLMSLALGNFGTVVRERLQMLVLIVPLIALGLAERSARRSPAEGGSVPAAQPVEVAPLELLPQG